MMDFRQQFRLAQSHPTAKLIGLSSDYPPTYFMD